VEHVAVAVRKRTWKTRKGEIKEAWIVDYVDQVGGRHIETFKKKKDADARAQQVGVDVRAGTHTPPSQSITLAQAGTDWLKAAERNGVGRGTLKMYRQHIEHITKRLGASKKIASLTKPDVVKFVDKMLDGNDGKEKEMSRAMARKVMTSLGSLLNVAHERGNIAQNVAAKVRVKPDTRGRAKLQVGVDIPTPVEVRCMLAASTGKMRAILHVAAFAGLRSSELRGLRWQDVNWKENKLHVRQRADLFNEIGPPKSRAGERTIPVPPMVVNTLREWQLLCPKSEGDLVFPTRTGAVSDHKALIRMLALVLKRAGLTDDTGKLKYTGLHALRHFYASWCINRKADGGLELPAKVVQERLGHASIVMTLDRYGHLFRPMKAAS
jgi:integrase